MSEQKRTAAEIIEAIKSLEKDGYDKEATLCLPFEELLELLEAMDSEILS